MHRRFTLGLFCLALLVGCYSASISGTVPVSGKVTYKGAPVVGAIITFVPEGNGRTATATSVENGLFSLTTVDARGAMPGKYKVTVEKIEFGQGGTSSMEAASTGSATEGQTKHLLPKKYSDVGSTPLAIEVLSGGKEDIDLAIVD